MLVRALLSSRGTQERQRLGSALIEALDDAFELPDCRLTVADRAQLHATDQRGRLARATYGYYRCRLGPGGEPERCGIRIYQRTAMKGGVVAPGAFTTTLLHEWCHHFDYAGLRLGRSPHTTGFFTRLRWLRSEVGALAGQEEDLRDATRER